jgi:hypothetical protein
MDEGCGAAPVEVDRLLGTEGDQQPGQLGQAQTAIDARPAPVAADREQLGVAQPQCATRVPAHGDVGVELAGRCGEPLPILPVHQGLSIRHEQGPGLHQVTRGVAAELLAPRDSDAAVDLHAPTLGRPWRHDRVVLDDGAVDAYLAQRSPGIAKEEAGDHGLGVPVISAPVVQSLCLGEPHDPRGRDRDRVAHQVDRGLPPVAQAHAGELVGDVRGYGRSLRADLTRGGGASPSRALPARADQIRLVTPRAGSESSVGGERYLANWRDEIDSAALYRALADLESDPRLADVYRRLAAAEERHAGFWEEKLRAAGATGCCRTSPRDGRGRRPGLRKHGPGDRPSGAPGGRWVDGDGRMGVGAERARVGRPPARDRGDRDRGDPRRGARGARAHLRSQGSRHRGRAGAGSAADRGHLDGARHARA